MAKKGLSARQQKILEFIQSFDDERSYPPTIRDIQYACGISSTSVVDYNLHILEREGYIRRDREVSRGIEVLGASRDAREITRVPVLGYIAAGEPSPVASQESWASAEPVDTLELPEGFLGKSQKDVYALRVKGTSMIDALVDGRRRGDCPACGLHPGRRHGGGVAPGGERGHSQAPIPGRGPYKAATGKLHYESHIRGPG